MKELKSDPFSLLHQPARPCLHPDAVLASYRELSSRAHPDAGGDASTQADLSAARDILLDDVRRVRALLELHKMPVTEGGGQMPMALADAGFQVEPVLKAARALIQKHGMEPGLLVVAMLTDERIVMNERLLACQAALDHLERESLAALDRADAAWVHAGDDSSARAVAGHEARQAADALVYLRRWKSQVAECLHQLALFDALIP